jgi:hypothetical protein
VLTSYTKSSFFPSITLGNGSSIPIYCVDQDQILSPTKPPLLRDVLVAPALIKKLASVPQFIHDNLVYVEFDLFGLSVKAYLTKAEIARLNNSVDLYSLHGVPVGAPLMFMVASIDLWHQRHRIMLFYRLYIVNFLYLVIEILIIPRSVSLVN